MEFKFITAEKDIVVNGHGFKLRAGDVATYEKIEALKREAEAQDEGEAESAGGVKRLCALISKQIDAMLGDGAYSRIFEGRPLNFLDHMELISWLMAESEKMAAERRLALLGPRAVSVNTAVVDARLGPDDPVQ